MAKRTAKETAEASGKVVEIVTRTTERRTGEDDRTEILVTGGEGGEFDPLDSLDDLGDSDARLEIRRTSPAEFAGYVGTYSRDGFSPDRLMEDWGGGKFTIRVRNPDGTMRGQRHVTIAGKPKNKEVAAPVAAPAAAPSSDNGQLAQVLSAIQASNVAAREATAGQISLLTTLLTSLINKEAPKPAPQPDPLAILEKAASILKPRGGDEGGAMAAFIKGLDMGKDLAGGGDGPSMAGVFMEGIKTIKEAAVISQSQPRPAQAARRIAAPPPGSVPAAAPVEAPNKVEKPVITDTMRQLAWIKQQAAFLVIQAKREKNAELYAELFVDNLPPFLPESLVLEQMKDDGAVQKLGLMNADVLKFPEWFEEFRAAVVEFIEQPGDEDDDAPTAVNAAGVIEVPDVGEHGGGSE